MKKIKQTCFLQSHSSYVNIATTSKKNLQSQNLTHDFRKRTHADLFAIGARTEFYFIFKFYLIELTITLFS